MRKCKACQKELIRREYENPKRFEEREYCNRACSLKHKTKYPKCRCGARLLPNHYTEVTCGYCGKKHKVIKCLVRDNNKYKACSFECRSKIISINKKKNGTTAKKEKHWNWKGGRINHQGYIMVHRPDHPASRKAGYVMEHRVIMEEKIGRYLTDNEVVHHINGDKADNRIENLVLCKTRAEHNKINHNKIDYTYTGGYKTRKEYLEKMVELYRLVKEKKKK